MHVAAIGCKKQKPEGEVIFKINCNKYKKMEVWRLNLQNESLGAKFVTLKNNKIKIK